MSDDAAGQPDLRFHRAVVERRGRIEGRAGARLKLGDIHGVFSGQAILYDPPDWLKALPQ